jgi:hypothetical protein
VWAVAVPGMVDQRTGQVLKAPALGWQAVDLRTQISAATGLPVQIENSGPRVHRWRIFGLSEVRQAAARRISSM